MAAAGWWTGRPRIPGLAADGERVADEPIWRGWAGDLPAVPGSAVGTRRPGRLSVDFRVGLWLESGREEPAVLGRRDGLDTWPAPVARRPLALSQLVPCSREGARQTGRV